MHATLPEWETTLDGASRSRSACGYLLSRVCIPETRALGEASSRFSCRAALPAYGYPTRAALARGAMLGASGAWPDADRTPDRELTKQISLTLENTLPVENHIPHIITGIENPLESYLERPLESHLETVESHLKAAI